MSLFEWIQSLVLTGSLVVIAVQSWLMRRAVGEQRNQLLVQSCLQVWQAHIQSCHLPVVTADDEIARELLKMTPYNQLELGEGVKSFVDSPASSHGRESGKLYFIGGKTCEGRVLTKTINSQQKI